MMTLILIVQIIACLFLIALVLLQDPKASGGSAMFGGTGSNTVVGATGGATLLQRLTRYSAIVFGVCCLLLTMMSRREASSGSVFENLQDTGAKAPISAPADPAQATIPGSTTDMAPQPTPESKTK